MTLQEMQKIHIKDIDPDSVVDYANISVKTELPKNERMTDVLMQMGGNPYFIKVGKILVKMSHIETDISINKRWEDHLRTV
jgi:hypothetical protein